MTFFGGEKNGITRTPELEKRTETLKRKQKEIIRRKTKTAEERMMQTNVFKKHEDTTTGTPGSQGLLGVPFVHHIYGN